MKTVLPYKTNTCLGEWLKKERQKMMIEKGETVLLQDLEQELAEYCGLTINGIRRIKRNLCSPSIEVAFKIAEFFNVKVSDIFSLVNKEDLDNIGAREKGQLELI